MAKVKTRRCEVLTPPTRRYPEGQVFTVYARRNLIVHWDARWAGEYLWRGMDADSFHEVCRDHGWRRFPVGPRRIAA